MTLRHPNTTDAHLAFKVKTTQPRRYLVRPNQGVIAPGESETIGIILVEKDKQSLLQTFDRLGQAGLDHSKDKFLVQSCTVPSDFALLLNSKASYSNLPSPSNQSVYTTMTNSDDKSTHTKTTKEVADTLTSMWNQAMSSSNVTIHNKKLHVQHIVNAAPTIMTETTKSNTNLNMNMNTAIRPDVKPPAVIQTTTTVPASTTLIKNQMNMNDQKQRQRLPMEQMTQDQVLTEVTSLRRKYDELVAFSVNLTAERDILNNTLEQTKRDLNREIAQRSTMEHTHNITNSGSGGANLGAGSTGAASGTNNDTKAMSNASQTKQHMTGSGFTLSLVQILVVALACFLAGIKSGLDGSAKDMLGWIPFLPSLLGLD